MSNTTPDFAGLFLDPPHPRQRQYEALRARFVDRKPYAQIEEEFGISAGYLRNLATELRKTRSIPGFDDRKAKAKAHRDARIVALRVQEQLSTAEIAQRLKDEDIQVGTTTIGLVLKQAGFPKLPRRRRRTTTGITAGAPADVRQFKPVAARWFTKFGGLFLFAQDLAQASLEEALTSWPTSRRVPAAAMIRSLLTLKLWGIGRPYRVMPDILDPGSALFAGLNVLPKKSTLTAYSTRVDATHLDTLMDYWHQASQAWLPASDGSMDLDFHTIPYHGDEALMQKHFVSKRSRRQRGVLALVAREASQRRLIYGNAALRKETQNDAVLEFVELWKKRTGKPPQELVFDSRFTTYANLAQLHEQDICFLTLRRRAPSILRLLHDQPAERWKKIRLYNIGRKYATPRILDEVITLRNYPHPLRQLAICDLGHDKPTLLITNRMKERAARLVDRYARRMLVENAIEDAINFFHMDALSSTVPLRINLDLQLTIMASTLYQALAQRLGESYTTAKCTTLFQHFVSCPAWVETTEKNITVQLNRRAHNNQLRAAGYVGSQGDIPWMHGRELIITYA